MTENGFWYSLDAILALLIVTGILLAMPPIPNPDWTPVIVAQKQHDLFKYWLSRELPTVFEMSEDVQWVFPHNGFELTVGNQTVSQNNTGLQRNASTVKTTWWQTPTQSVSIRLTIHY